MKVSVVLYKSKTLANGEHPIMLRVTKDRKRKYLSLGISSSEKFWDAKENRPNSKHPNRDIVSAIITSKLAEYEKVKLSLKSEGKDFTSASLIKQVEKPLLKTTVFGFYDELIDRLESENRIGNANVYKDAKRALKNFTGNMDVTFSEIDYAFLVRFRTHLRKNGLRDTSISAYFRNLRALFNKAIKENRAKREHYPFDTFKISELNIETRKRAICKSDMIKIEELDLVPGSSLFDAKSYFLFTYYGKGINFTDIAKLKWNDISNERVYYTRSKTGKLIDFGLLDPAQRIIEHYKEYTYKTSSDYIFPILDKQKHKTAKQIDNRIHKVITQVNRSLKEIGSMIGLEFPLTTYVARHTFANVLKNSDVSVAVISEAMGHKTESVTNTYLKSFENDRIDEAMNNLLKE